jgi:hypothetical protein
MESRSTPFLISEKTPKGQRMKLYPKRVSWFRMDRQEINYEIFQCVDRGLSAYSSSVTHVTYWRLLTAYDLKPSDIPADPESFSKALSEIFGAGAVIIERSIVKELVARFRIACRKLPNFVTAVNYILNEEKYVSLEVYAEIENAAGKSRNLTRPPFQISFTS